MSASETKWVRLGEYIEQSDKRNSDGALTETDVQGISTDKCFIPTKANLDGVSVLSYKIVALSEFAYVADTSRRGDKVALALNSSEKNILISSIYTVFHSTDENILLPEYMFLLFNRSEFDRYSRFNSWGSARETFDWSEMERVQIPLPSIEVQRELVATYNGLKTLAEQNEALIPRLSAACQAYIVDCRAKYPSVPLGKYIEQSDERNSEGMYLLEDVTGISNEKSAIPTKADMKDVSLTPYKIFKPNEFCYVTVTSRNVGNSLAYEVISTHSICRAFPLPGLSCNNTALAPSLSIKRRKSFSNAMYGCIPRLAHFSYSTSKFLESNPADANSEQLQTALRLSPAKMLRYAILNA